VIVCVVARAAIAASRFLFDFAYDATDNMVYNSGLCANTLGTAAAPKNKGYDAQGATAVRPHAQSAICGAAVPYDTNGNP
jgi:hypothetical protein